MCDIGVERVDGTQARLKQYSAQGNDRVYERGKGGWDSGEIETSEPTCSNNG